MKNHITENMTIGEVLTQYPRKGARLAQEMVNAGLNCVGCGASVWETLEEGVLGHGFSKDDLDKLLIKLNAILSEEGGSHDTIAITPRAADKYREILADENKIGWALRLEDRIIGCSSSEYILEYSKEPLSDDEVFHSEGIDIHVQRESARRLMGSTIDYIEGVHGSGFKVINPNVKKGKCNCGSS